MSIAVASDPVLLAAEAHAQLCGLALRGFEVTIEPPARRGGYHLVIRKDGAGQRHVGADTLADAVLKAWERWGQ